MEPYKSGCGHAFSAEKFTSDHGSDTFLGEPRFGLPILITQWYLWDALGILGFLKVSTDIPDNLVAGEQHFPRG